MQLQDSISIHCPYCAEPISTIVDCSISAQEYVEDCEVCCRPITLVMRVDEHGELSVTPRQEGESV